jgi:hypothetical protein
MVAICCSHRIFLGSDLDLFAEARVITPASLIVLEEKPDSPELTDHEI